MLLSPAAVGGGELSIYIVELKKQQQQQRRLAGSFESNASNEHAAQRMCPPARPLSVLVYTQLPAPQTISSSIMEKLKTL